MIRKKITVPPGTKFDAFVREAMKLCDVVLTEPRDRLVVVECENDKMLDPLRRLGGQILDDRQYKPDLD